MTTREQFLQTLRRYCRKNGLDFEVMQDRYIERTSRSRLHLLPPEVETLIEGADDKNHRARLVCDWLANLTDRGAFRVHQRLFDMSFSKE